MRRFGIDDPVGRSGPQSKCPEMGPSELRRAHLDEFCARAGPKDMREPSSMRTNNDTCPSDHGNLVSPRSSTKEAIFHNNLAPTQS